MPVPGLPSNATPLDVIKNSDQSGLIKNVTVITAPQWRARMLKDSLRTQELNTVIEALANADITEVLNQKQPQKRYLMTELIDEYNSILYRKKKYTEETYQRIWQQVQNARILEDNKYKIDLTEYKNPIKSPPDSQWAIGINREEGETHLAFSYMPASHDIYDDNRQYFGENELKLAAFSVQANKSKIFVEEFTLYGVQSIIPRDPILGGISGKMNVGYYRQYNKALEKKGTFHFQAGLGVSSEPIRSVSMFAFLTAGAGHGENTAYASLSPEVGLIVREANNFKSHISVKYDWNQFNSGKGIYSFQLKQAKYLGNNIGFFVAAGHHRSGSESANELSIVVKRYF